MLIAASIARRFDYFSGTWCRNSHQTRNLSMSRTMCHPCKTPNNVAICIKIDHVGMEFIGILFTFLKSFLTCTELTQRNKISTVDPKYNLISQHPKFLGSAPPIPWLGTPDSLRRKWVSRQKKWVPRQKKWVPRQKKWVPRQKLVLWGHRTEL